VIALVFALTVAPAPPAPAAELTAMVAAQQAAWNAGWLDDFLTPYLDGPDLRFYSGGTITRGKEAVAARYRKNYRADGKEMGSLAFDAVETDLFGPDAGLVRGKWAVTTKAGTVGGLFTLICKKTPAGWRIVHDHTSKADPEPKKP